MRGLIAGLGHGFKPREPQFSVDHLVIGGGVVGLAVAQRLSKKFPEKLTYLIERHDRVGEETSSRNSEVIHAGLYYPLGSLKSRLCIRGRTLMYAYCEKHSIPHKKLGKLVVALPHQEKYIEKLHAHCHSLRLHPNAGNPDDAKPAVPTELISGDQARELEPDLSSQIAKALWSHETGIVDSHSFMDSLESDITSSEGGEVVLGTRVVRVDPTSEGWIVQMLTSTAEEPDVVFAKTLINASGLASHQILNHLLPQLNPPEPKIPIYYARGSYASYRGAGVKRVQRLIYPVADETKGYAFTSLGTHLTVDLEGNVKFGPDVEWIEPPSAGEGDSDRAEDVDYWSKHLVPSDARMSQMHESIATYLPNVALDGLRPDYVGIRPKMSAPGGKGGFNDFVVRSDWSGRWTRGDGREREGGNMITLMGIESPGLTSSLAIAEMVAEEVLASQ
ncbi:hypothetical protein M407DRAFT_66539 [Tulasnella calospora MUT 4182]|uniref:L-2-hydroxyglutarate dehydrogenase, mitochondrial n=1 Tax=Tulasnella calospora MUT 4182 TaxID=1051891 RepID=A0A0C3MFF6_9AGAM|nr:hypothetical protein M407DRAFT_66539 [Tulasnella calospora MUT 4182]